MAQKTSFTADEWKAILASPMLAGMAVTLAEPSGLWGLMKEGMASGEALLDVRRNPGASELAKALVAEIETSAGRSAARDEVKADLTGKSPVEMRQQIIATLTRVGQIRTCEARWRSQPIRKARARQGQGRSEIREAGPRGQTLQQGRARQPRQRSCSDPLFVE